MTERIAVRIAKKHHEKEHRDFTGFENYLNKFKLSEELFEEMRPHLSPYKLKADTTEGMPFRYLSLYKLKELCKVMEASERWREEELEPIRDITTWMFMFRDLLHIETSEAVAVWLIFKKHFEDWVNQNKRNPSDAELGDITYKSIQQFRSDWTSSMRLLEDVQLH